MHSRKKNTLPVGSPNYSGIAEMAINKQHALMIFTEMILNDFKHSFSKSKSSNGSKNDEMIIL